MVQKFKTKNLIYFPRFVLIFTTIFLVMTVIILQLLQNSVYTGVDNDLKIAQKDIDHYIEFRMGVISESGNKPRTKPSTSQPYKELNSTTTFLLFDADGGILNNTDFISDLTNSYQLNTSNLNEIEQALIPNYWNDKEIYRLVTVPINNITYPEVAYATVLINVTRLEETHSFHVRIIVGVMIFFWLLSLIASLYLANWAQKPILQSFERQKTFVENASHELRTPLAVLQNRLEGLFRHPDTSILDNSESIAASLDEVRNMKLLTTNLLNLARRDEGLEPQLEELQASFFDDLFDNYQLIAEENTKAFVADNDLEQAFISDPTLLKQLVTILFDNAVKYTEDDGLIGIFVYQKDKKLCIEVKDNGPGIPDEDKPKIFDRFYRVDKARTRQKGGFGLGLALAQQIVTSLKGTISLEDNHPQGTIFKVVL